MIEVMAKVVIMAKVCNKILFVGHLAVVSPQIGRYVVHISKQNL